MTTHNPDNERLKRQYLRYLKESSTRSEATLDQVAKALSRFESYSKYKSFKAFHFEQAIAFKKHLTAQLAQRSGENLSKATLHSTLANLRRFFHWLAGQTGYKSRFTYSDSDYFNLSGNDARIATAHREQKAPTLEQIKHVIAQMPATTEIERRDRALVAFTLLTGARDRATASLKLKHIDLAGNCVYQDGREVATKLGKTFTTFFFPVGDDVREIVAAWVTYLRQEKLWGNDDPLFPATQVGLDRSGRFGPAGLKREHWRSAAKIRAIFRTAFTSAGLPYFNPHSFRNALVLLGEARCRTPEEFKSWSQNLGHEKVMTTLISYGQVPVTRQGEIIAGMLTSRNSSVPDVEQLAEALARKMRGDK